MTWTLNSFSLIFMSLSRFCLFVSLFAFLSFYSAKAQFTDDFSDGDFTNNPNWTSSNVSGTGSDFQVSSLELQSNGPAASATIWISTDQISDFASANTVWTFKARYANAPSGSNKIRIFLVSDKADLSDIPQGYYIEMGETGSDDGIDFYKTGSAAPLIEDPNPTVASEINVTIRVTRTDAGEWTLEVDPTGGNSFTTIGSVTDTEFTSGSNFGFLVAHTSTRNQDFFFDDVTVSFTDTSPPALQGVTIISSTAIDVQFSEDLDQTTAENSSNYSVNNGIGAPSSATLDATDLSLVHLTFSNTFENATDYALTVSNVEDLNGNAITSAQESFFYFVEQPAENKDIIISEIMAAPKADNTLPNAEYIELFNRSSKTFDLENWTLSDPSSTGTLSSYFLQPGAYLILTSTNSASAFSTYGEVLGISNFPTLNNDGDQLVLHAASGLVVDTVAYTNDWYNDSQKAGSGYSLELIDPDNFCGAEENWAASTAADKGTPGVQNSVFDDQFDITPPFIESSAAVALNQITITFNQRIDAGSVDLTDFSIDQGNAIASASILSDSPETVQLDLSGELVPNTVYNVSVTGLSDCSGNMISTVETAEVIFVEGVTPDYKDLVINEILVDPEPQNDLPAAEYVELFNRSDKIFDLENWTFSDQSTTAILPKTVLFPGDYLVMCPFPAVAEFEVFGATVGLSSWPSLNNSGDILILRDNSGNTVDSVAYDDAWYNSSIKQEGGWTLELIDPENECGEEENWTASENSAGGTPAAQNSVFSQNPDLTGPKLQQALALKEDSIVLRFNEKLDLNSAQTATFVIEPNIVINSKIVGDNLREIILNTSAISAGQQYTITVNNIADCSGNLIDQENNSLQFSLIEKANALDVIINEILFNPRSAGVDFVEIYNRSKKYLNLRGWLVANGAFQVDSLTLESKDEITANDLLLAPGEYLALTENKLVLLEQYPQARDERILEVADLPSFSNDEGLVAITDAEEDILDFFSYNEDFHSPLLDDVDGVSLERVSPEEKTNLPDNWKSATATVGFATPGYENSQSREKLSVVDGEVIIEPKVIVPDGSGQNDFATINYRFSSSGNVATVRVFDVQGRLIKEIANNSFLSAEGFFTWDGTDESGRKARTGYYIVLFELFNASGNTETIKEKVVVGSRFE